MRDDGTSGGLDLPGYLRVMVGIQTGEFKDKSQLMKRLAVHAEEFAFYLVCGEGF